MDFSILQFSVTQEAIAELDKLSYTHVVAWGLLK
jgi:hypothetical protein